MLGARIALLRRQNGMSQRALAEALHVSPSAVGMYEQERRTPPNAVLLQMAKLFSVSTDFLLTGQPAAQDAPHSERVGLPAASPRARRPRAGSGAGAFTMRRISSLLNPALQSSTISDSTILSLRFCVFINQFFQFCDKIGKTIDIGFFFVMEIDAICRPVPSA